MGDRCQSCHSVVMWQAKGERLRRANRQSGLQGAMGEAQVPSFCRDSRLYRVLDWRRCLLAILRLCSKPLRHLLCQRDKGNRCLSGQHVADPAPFRPAPPRRYPSSAGNQVIVVPSPKATHCLNFSSLPSRLLTRVLLLRRMHGKSQPGARLQCTRVSTIVTTHLGLQTDGQEHSVI